MHVRKTGQDRRVMVLGNQSVEVLREDVLIERGIKIIIQTRIA